MAEDTQTQSKEYIWGTGRRKTSVARVRLAPGDGKIFVNGKPAEDYFSNEKEVTALKKPLEDTDRLHKYRIKVNATGGGKQGQAEATLLGIARALVQIEPELQDILREKGHLTRDPRMKERRKYGKHGARRGKQYSKR